MIQKVLVIVITYNGMRWYDRCLGSLMQSSIPVDVFVVDNASTDGSADWIAEHYPQVYLVRSECNLGFGQANNIGLRYALENGYDYVFLLNQDAWLHKDDCIERLVETAESEQTENYMILSALWLYGKADRLTKGTPMHLAAMAQRGNDFASDLFFKRTLQPIYQTDYIGAAAWLLSRQTLQTIGGFDPLFLHRGEDDNYMQRVRFHGGKIGICPYAVICHDIEERPADYDAEHDDWKKNFLIELADINNTRTLKQWRKLYLLQSLKQFTYGHWKGARQNWKTYRFICERTKSVGNSKSQNIIRKANWL